MGCGGTNGLNCLDNASLLENEDHHCIWLNNCVGKRNYRSFFTFISTAFLLCCYVIAFSLVHLLSLYLEGDRSFGHVLSRAPVSLLLAILCFILAMPVGGLTGYHCFLTMRGVTTHEQVAKISHRNNKKCRRLTMICI